MCREEVSIHVIQSRSHILNTYSEAISDYAERKFSRDGVDLITDARVSAVESDKVIYSVKDAEGKTVTRELLSNFVLWSTGIAMNPFTERVSNLLPNQVHRKAIETDAHLRVKGAPLGDVYAIGDASTVSPPLSLISGINHRCCGDRDVHSEPSTRARGRGRQGQEREDRL